MVEQKIIDKFNSKVEKLESGCWVFTGARNAQGYGIFNSSYGRSAHRFSWLANHGMVPKGLLVCHSCDNPPCVRIDHLWLGTQQQNMQDMVRKNRREIASAKNNAMKPKPVFIIESEWLRNIVKRIYEAK